jgi:hypothetical protein
MSGRRFVSCVAIIIRDSVMANMENPYPGLHGTVRGPVQ